MSNCCHDKDCELEALRERHMRVLWIVFGINFAMFGVEAIAGYLAHSVALLADSSDMLGDTLVYGFSLYAVRKTARWRAGAALAKGVIMAAFGLGVLVEIFFKLTAPVAPESGLMGGVAALALVTNGFCLYLLTAHRHDDINMRSTWLCSRNDIVANTGVILAAVAVFFTSSIWPDVIISAVIVGVFLKSAVTVLSESIRQLWPRTFCPAGTCPATSCKC